nr:hypothetical protein [uncultured Campylobacter sp.]
MKFSSLALATTLALAFAGCALDDALNSVTGAIDSITAPNGTNNTSTNSKAEVKSFKTAKDLEHFCNTAPEDIKYKVTSLPPLKWGKLAGTNNAELNVVNSKINITLEPRNHIRFENSFFGPEYDPRTPNQTVKMKKSMFIEKETANGYNCHIIYY